MVINMKVKEIRHPDNPNKFGTHKRRRSYNVGLDGDSYSVERLKYLIENGLDIPDLEIVKKFDWFVVFPQDQYGTFPNKGEIVRGCRRTLRDALYVIQTGKSFGNQNNENKNQRFPKQEKIWKEYLEKYPDKIHPYWVDSLRRDMDNRKIHIENIQVTTKVGKHDLHTSK